MSCFVACVKLDSGEEHVYIAMCMHVWYDLHHHM